MKINSKIFKRKSGKSKGRWVCRISYFDEILGIEKKQEKLTASRTAAIEYRNKTVLDIQNSRGQLQSKMSFDQLADICEELFYKPAKISVDGKKVSGVRSIGSARSAIANLRAQFAKTMIAAIGENDITNYKAERLSPNDPKTSAVKIATVNRELQIMRRMLRYARSRDWVSKNVFSDQSLIETSAEVARTRILSREEEVRLFAACTGDEEVEYERKRFGNVEKLKVKVVRENPILRAAILLAIDSALRKNEILRLKWTDINFEDELITVRGTTTKTERTRIAPLSQRTVWALQSLRTMTTGEEIFNIADFKQAFEGAKIRAKISDLRFHDLRASAISRWIRAGIPLAEVSKLAGHSLIGTTQRYYVVPGLEAVKAVNESMNLQNRAPVANEVEIESSLIN